MPQTMMKRKLIFSFPIPEDPLYTSTAVIVGSFTLLPMEKKYMTQDSGPEIVQEIASHTVPFLERYALIPQNSGRSTYTSRMIDVMARCSLLLNPGLAVQSPELIWHSKLIAWNWVFDETLEPADHCVLRKVVPILVEMTAKIIRREPWECTVTVKEYPLLNNFLNAFEELMEEFDRDFMKYEPDYSNPIIHALANYLQNFEYKCYNTFTSEYGEEEVRQWRRWDGFVDFDLELSAALMGARLPGEIRFHRLLQRCMELAARNFTIANDVVGIPKDSVSRDPSSTLAFGLFHKRPNLNENVKIITTLLTEEVTEYTHCRETLFIFFPDNPDLKKFMIVCDAYMGQNNDLYDGYGSERYGPLGYVKIIEDK